VLLKSRTLLTIAESETGCQSCIDAGAPLVLTELAREKLVKENVVAARYIANALSNIAKSNAGRQSCIDAQAPLALVSLSHGIEDYETIKSVKKAIWIISGTEIGRQACIDAKAPYSFIDWASKKSSRMNDLIMMNCTGAANTGSVLVILAQNGYTQEAHQIIGLSRTASLIGRDSNGGLPELWDVMGKVKGKGGITRLMAICITRGPDSPQRARALIQYHKVDVTAKDDQDRTALHHAFNLRSKDKDRWEKDPWPRNIPINFDVIRVLITLCPSLALYEDIDKKFPIYHAIFARAPYDIIKLLFCACSYGLSDKLYSYLPNSTVILLAHEPLVKEDETATLKVVFMLIGIIDTSYSSKSQAECIVSGIPLALTTLAHLKAVKGKDFVAKSIAKALTKIAKWGNEGIQSCIDAGAPLALIALAHEVPNLQHDAIKSISEAFYKIAQSDAGRQSCIDAGVPFLLRTLKEKKKLPWREDSIPKTFKAITGTDFLPSIVLTQSKSMTESQ
jgi:hypothetical protein